MPIPAYPWFTFLFHFTSSQYLQNIRDNTGRGRTPAWAVKHGLLPKPKPPTHSWSNRYAERNADNVYDDEAVAAEGEEGMDSLATSRPKKGGIDQARRDRYHGATSSSSSSSAANGRKQNNSRSMDDNYVYDDDAESIGSHSFTRGPSSSSTLRDSNEDDDRSTRKKSSGGGGGIKSFFGGGGSSKKQKNRKKDRFEVEREARGIHGNGNGNAMNGAMGDEEYGDDFEREINGGRSRRSDAAPLAEENERVEGDGLDHRF